MLLCCVLAACQQSVPWQGRDVSGIFPDLSFSLIGSDGQEVQAGDFVGKPTLLYFGFTNCPGVCPTTLAQISAALDQLGQEAAHFQVILASVDPRRDTPSAMKEYTARFGPWLQALTGHQQALKDLNHAYKVDFSALAADEDGEYDVLHSNRVFAFDSRGRCRLLLPDTADTQAVVSDLRKLLAEDGMI
ncbi:MAG: SCO family protein [Xanthomonadales bacterium]|nr:SCO family protein [Xanthomonadales bacterium]